MDSFGILLGYFWILLRYFLDTFVILFGYFCDTFWMSFGYFLDTFWILWDTFRILLGYLRDTFGIFFKIPLGYFVDTFWILFGNFKNKYFFETRHKAYWPMKSDLSSNYFTTHSDHVPRDIEDPPTEFKHLEIGTY